MNKIQKLIFQIDCAEQLMAVKFQNERVNLCEQLFSKLVQTHQKVSLAEKVHNVKNVRSPISSD